MKKTIKVLFPILLTLAILASCCWYLFFYDRAFTRDALVSAARFCESQGYHSASTWFYDIAYTQIGNNDSVAIEHAEQYKKIGNYTKAEFTLRNAITNGASAELYIALSQTFVEQDKLLDAANMLNNITDSKIKQELEQMRPAAPSASYASGLYNQYITVEFTAADGTLYVATDGEYPSLESDRYTAPVSLGEGENNLYAMCVAENGLVSPVAVYSYTIGGIIRPVTFADPNVEAAVREILLIDSPVTIHTNDLWKIKEFTVPAGTRNYADIALMSYLEILTIEDAVSDQLSCLTGLNELTELKITETTVSAEVLSNIAAFPKLKTLTLSDCGLSSIAGLSVAFNLEYLDLSNNALRDLSPLSGLSKLKQLLLVRNAVEDLSPLGSTKQLTKLDVSYNALTDLSSLSGLSGLTWLNVDHNAISNAAQISELTSLSFLSMSNNKLKDINAITACAGLTELYVAGNELTSISALSSLTKLMYLDFSNNKVSTIPTWPKNCELVSINGSSNKIKSIAPLSGLKSLNVVSMDYNKDLSSVKDLANCPLLTQVNVYGTKVKDVSALTAQSVIVNYNPV